MKLSKNLLTKFNKNGFVLVKNFYNQYDIKKSLLSFKKKLSTIERNSTWTEKEPGDKLSVYSFNKDDPNFYKFAASKKLLAFAKFFVQNDVFISHSKCNLKQPWSGTVEYFHQDAVYTKPRCKNIDKMIMAMVMMENHTDENACLQLFKGSHKLGLLKHEMFININGLSKFTISAKKLTSLQEKFKIEKINADPGDVLFFHPLIIHGSNHNLSKKGRMIILTQLNSFNNELQSVRKNIIKYNTQRSKFEYNNALKRVKWFEKKFMKQKKSKNIEFIRPIIKDNN